MSPALGGGTQSRSPSAEGDSRRVLRTEQMQGRKFLHNRPLLTQRVGKEPRGCPGRGWASSHSLELGWAFLELSKERPNSPPFTLGGNGTGHTSHRKLTSKERVREECWLVPFPGLASRAAPVPSTAYISLPGSGWSHCDQRGCCPYLPAMPRATWSEWCGQHSDSRSWAPLSL